MTSDSTRRRFATLSAAGLSISKNPRYSRSMFRQIPTFRTSSPWRLLLGVLCIALVLLNGTLSVTHSHPDGVPHTDCGLCTTAHLIVQAGKAVTQVTVALVFIRRALVAIPSSIPDTVSDFALFTRPPPVDSSLA